jgi:hypothetical protein
MVVVVKEKVHQRCWRSQVRQVFHVHQRVQVSVETISPRVAIINLNSLVNVKSRVNM